ncbi:MAG: DUF4982 domain-containing protein [Prevotella sp.]|nr:DUF4982 domain-containing protein [Prevotella sp.]
MRRLSYPLVLTTLLLTAQSATAQLSFGHAESINADWLFLRADSAWNVRLSPEMAEADYDDKRWRRVNLPHDWGVELPMSPDKGSCQGYLPGGAAWYRKHLQLTPEPGRCYYVCFDGVYNHSEVYINGQLLGRRPSGFATFYYDLTPHLLPSGRQMLAVHVDHSDDADARWYTGSGINRNVWIVSAPQVHLAPWGTAYRLQSISNSKAVVDVDVETCDERADKGSLKLKAIVTMQDAEGNTVAQTVTPIAPQEKKTVRLTIKKPQRWSLERPTLYTLTTRLEANGKETDRSEVKAGLRTLRFSADHGFYLNERQTKVLGVCVHDDAGVLGTAVPAAVWRQRLTELKAIGVNAIRLSHNPHTPELYDLCDELGLLVMDEASDEWEFPKRKWLKGWNQGRPGFQGTYTYFEQWIERDVADMVRRDRCHPSVFLWSIGNEVDYPNDPYSHPVLKGTSITQPMYGGYKPEQPNAERIGLIAQRLARVVRDIDGSRPVTGALAGVVMSNQTLYPQAVDVVGYNYTESRYDEDHSLYPTRVIYGSENRHDLPSWLAVRDKEHIFGQFLWTGIDYLGESGVWPARGSSAGLLDLAGQRKPMGWYRAMLWSPQPTCYIGAYALPEGRRGETNRRSYVSPYADDVWQFRPGQRVRVVCYANTPELRLTLNGQPVEATLQHDADTDIRYWDLTYSPGTLRAEGLSGGKVVAAHEMHTSDRPVALHVEAITKAADMSAAGKTQVVMLLITAKDEAGHQVRLADNEVTVRVSGGGWLLGLENGNMQGPTPLRYAPAYRPADRLRLHGGRMVAYISCNTADTKPTQVEVSSPLLETARFVLPQ